MKEGFHWCVCVCVCDCVVSQCSIPIEIIEAFHLLVQFKPFTDVFIYSLLHLLSSAFVPILVFVSCEV